VNKQIFIIFMFNFGIIIVNFFAKKVPILNAIIPLNKDNKTNNKKDWKLGVINCEIALIDPFLDLSKR